MLKNFIVLAACSIVLLGCSGRSHDLVPIAKSMDAYVNAHDLDGFGKLLADDVVVKGPDGVVRNGKEEMIKWLGGMMTGFHVESTCWMQSGDTVTWMSTVHSDAYEKMGLNPMKLTATAVFSGDKLKYFNPQMTQETAGKMRFLQFYADVVNGGNVDAVDKYVAEDFVEHQPLPPGAPKGREGVRAFFKALHESFADFHGTPTLVMGDGENVLIFAEWTGTFEKAFMGIPPNHKKMTWTVADVVRVVDGKAEEHWGLDDMMSQLMHGRR
jgi:steroid delta-isomerase-like uncharacterized protein